MKVSELLEILSEVSDKGKRIIFILSGVKLHRFYLEYEYVILSEDMTVRKLASILLEADPLCDIKLTYDKHLFIIKVTEYSKIYVELVSYG